MYATVVDVDGDDVILEVAPGVEVRYLKRAVMDVVAPADEDTDSADETDEIDDLDETDDSDLDEEPSDDAEDIADDAPESADDAEETAYEQATGTKKD